MKFILKISLACTVVFGLTACSNDDEATHNDPPGANLIIRFAFDENQARLDNLGQVSTIPAGNAAQTPAFNSMSAHYIELAPNALTALGAGEIVYQGAETSLGGSAAIDFDQARVVAENQQFLSIPIAQVTAGTYEWVRTSLSYQNYKIDVLQSDQTFNGTLASFVGFNNYITSFLVNTETVTVNNDVLQGFWAFEVAGQLFQGQAPQGATTVPNPLFATSPIPQGSCVVKGQFSTPLTITGNETDDVLVTLSLSINNSFEWQEVNTDGQYEPAAGEQVVDMGFRGLVPTVN